jgi:TonB family protein
VQIDIEVEIRLKFWVLPDGTVGEVIPLQRGDVRLERAAIEYLKSWRFTPIAPDRPKVWGIIPIKYKLQ